MNNYYRLLSVDSTAEHHSLNQRLDELAAKSPELAEDIALIFGKPGSKKEYDKLHLQYCALAQAYQVLAEYMPVDTCNWSDRLREFS